MTSFNKQQNMKKQNKEIVHDYTQFNQVKQDFLEI